MKTAPRGGKYSLDKQKESNNIPCKLLPFISSAPVSLLVKYCCIVILIFTVKQIKAGTVVRVLLRTSV